MEKKVANQWKHLVEPALKSKEIEFKMIGYHDVTTTDIWNCLEKQVWKGNPEKRLHEIIQDIFQLHSSTYMNHIQVGALQVEQDDLMDSIHALSVNNHEE